MKQVSFKSNEVIFRQGEPSLVMYDIISGRVGVFADYGTKKERIITELGKDQTLGELGMIGVYPRSATAVALEETVLAEIGDAELDEYFNPAW